MSKKQEAKEWRQEAVSHFIEFDRNFLGARLTFYRRDMYRDEKREISGKEGRKQWKKSCM